MPRASLKPKVPRVAASRYGIAEWFGKDIAVLSPEERQAFGRLAVRQTQTDVRNLADAGGVCSIRKYAPGPDNKGTAIANDRTVTVCPTRFIQEVKQGKSLFGWISEKMLDVANPIIVKETPFLRKVSDARLPAKIERDPDAATDIEAEEEEEKKAGRIDWIVVIPPA